MASPRSPSDCSGRTAPTVTGRGCGSGSPPGSAGSSPSTRSGLYGSSPPPGGYQAGDTAAAQARIDASEVETVLEVPDRTTAEVVAATVLRDNDGTPTGAPMVVRLPDGRHMALAPADGEVLEAVGRLDVPGLVGTVVVVDAGGPRYRLPTD